MNAGHSFLRIQLQTRTRGHSATGTVCYRNGLSGTSTFDGPSGEKRTFDYTRRTDVIATGYAAPPGTDPSWVNPITWAHRIEAVDKRKNSRQCRDDVVAIPIALVEAGLAEEAIQTYADRLARLHGTPVHWAFHKPDRGGKNYHCHFLYAGRRLNGLGFAKHRDREQDNPKDKDAPDLATVHKGVWSEICGLYGIELRWTSETPGHHLGPQICATKRRRLAAETRDAIAKTIAASRTGEAVPDERTLDDISMIAGGRDGLTVNEMLQNELKHAQQGRPEPREVTAPVPPQAEVLPPNVFAPEILPPTVIAPKILPPAEKTPQVPPPVRLEPEVFPPVHTMPEVLPPVPQPPEVLPPICLAPRLLPPARRAEVLPPTRTALEILPPVWKAPDIPPPQLGKRKREQELDQCVGTIVFVSERECPNESSSTWTAVGEQLDTGHKTPVGGVASRAAGDLATRARRREESKGMPPPPAADPDRISMLVERLLAFTRRLLEQLHLKKKKRAKSAPEPGERSFHPRPQGGRQERKRGLGHQTR